MRWKHTAGSSRTTWMLASAGAAMLAGRLMERGLESGWRRVKHEDPPELMGKREQSWSTALGWAALSAAAVAATQLAARRGAQLGLKKLTGKRPPAAA